MDWTLHGVAKSRTRQSDFSFPFMCPTVSCRMPSVTLTLSPNLRVGFLPWNWRDPWTQGELTQSRVPEGCIHAGGLHPRRRAASTQEGCIHTGPCLLALAASRLCLGPWRRLAGLRALGAGSQGSLLRHWPDAHDDPAIPGCRMLTAFGDGGVSRGISESLRCVRACGWVLWETII